MICVCVIYTVKPGSEADAVEHLLALERGTRSEPGNRTFNTHRSKDDPRVFFIYEQFVDEAAIEAHRATPHYERHAKNGMQSIAESRLAAFGPPLS